MLRLRSREHEWLKGGFLATNILVASQSLKSVKFVHLAFAKKEGADVLVMKEPRSKMFVVLRENPNPSRCMLLSSNGASELFPPKLYFAYSLWLPAQEWPMELRRADEEGSGSSPKARGA